MLFKNQDQIINNGQTPELKKIRKDILEILSSANDAVNPYNAVKSHIINNEFIIILKDNKYLNLVLIFLKNHYKLQYKELVDICTVDYLSKRNKRFEVNYMLLSIKYKFRIRIKTFLKDSEILTSCTN